MIQKGSVILLVLWMAVQCSGLQVMPWLCLERCNDTSVDMALSLEQVARLAACHCLAGSSFELYNLGPQGQLLRNPLTNVGPLLARLGPAWPMISSYPYPPQFLSWMRQLWTNSSVADAFVTSLLAEASQHGWAGYQVDWEPTAAATAQDALDYASFLDSLAHRIAPLKVIPTVATWNAIWNLQALGKTNVVRTDFPSFLSLFAIL